MSIGEAMPVHPVAEGMSAARWRWILLRTQDEPLRFVLQMPEQPAGFRRLRAYDRTGLHIGTLGWQVCDMHQRGFIAKISVVGEWQGQGVGRQMIVRALQDGPGYAWTTSGQSAAGRGFFAAVSTRTGATLAVSHDRCAHMKGSMTQALGRGALIRLS